MPRDNLVGSSSRCLAAREALLSRCALTTSTESSDDRPTCPENPRPEGAESTLTENAASPFQAEPRHGLLQSPVKTRRLPDEVMTFPTAMSSAGSSRRDRGEWERSWFNQRSRAGTVTCCRPLAWIAAKCSRESNRTMHVRFSATSDSAATAVRLDRRS